MMLKPSCNLRDQIQSKNQIRHKIEKPKEWETEIREETLSHFIAPVCQSSKRQKPHRRRQQGLQTPHNLFPRRRCQLGTRCPGVVADTPEELLRPLCRCRYL